MCGSPAINPTNALVSRDFPIPASPESSTTWPSPSVALKKHRRNNSNSSLRPTRAVNSVARSASKRLATKLACSTAHARTGPAIPLRLLIPRSLSWKKLPRSLRVLSATTTVLGSAMLWSRAARFGVSPTMPRSSDSPDGITCPTTTTPVAIPTRDLLRSTRLEPSNYRNQLKPSPDRSLGVVLMGMRITKVHKDAIPHISGDEPAEVAHGLGDAFLIGRNDLSQVLRVHAGGKRGRTDQVREHHRDLAALGFVPWARVGPRRKLGRGGGGSGKLGNRPEQSPAISKRHDAKLLLEILVREVLKDRKIDPVFDKAVRILGQAKRS